MRDVVDPSMCQAICHARGKYDYPSLLPGAACALKVSKVGLIARQIGALAKLTRMKSKQWRKVKQNIIL